MNIFKWFPFFKSKKETTQITSDVLHPSYQKALEKSKGRIIRKLPPYESPHDEVERVRRIDSTIIDDIITAGIASTIFDDSPSQSHISGIDSYDSDSHSHSNGFDGGFGGGGYSGGGSGGDWGSSDSSSYDSGSSSDYSSND